MYDDFPDGKKMLKPALKGHEGEKAAWGVWSTYGCTFWKNGKCELHSLGLKPSQGKLALHDMPEKECSEVSNFIEESWKDKKSKKIINRWKKLNKIEV